MNNKINNYLIANYFKVLLNVICFFCLGLILNLFEEVEFLRKFVFAYNFNVILFLI